MPNGGHQQHSGSFSESPYAQRSHGSDGPGGVTPAFPSSIKDIQYVQGGGGISMRDTTSATSQNNASDHNVWADGRPPAANQFTVRQFITPYLMY